MKIGAQLYTVRDYCRDLDSFAETLKKIADIGYPTVQVSGTCGYEGAWLRDRLKETGLQCVLTHNSPKDIVENTDALIAKHDEFDCQYVGLGAFGFNDQPGQTWDDFIRDFKPAARRLAEGGKYFMYHNHAHEFQKWDGKLLFDRLIEAMTPDEMGVTVDTFWVQVGGGAPAWWLEKLSGRIPCIHLKDYAFDRKMAVVGEGNLNFDRIFEKAEAGGTQYMLVEQDDCNGEDPFDCLRRSYDYLRSRGF